MMAPPLIPDAAAIHKANEQRNYDPIKGAVGFGALAQVGAVLQSAAPGVPLIGKITGGITAFHVDDAARLRPAKPGPLTAWFYIGPAPFGVILPEDYGIDPRYIQRGAPDLPPHSLFGNTPTPERIVLFEAEQHVEKILSRDAAPKGKTVNVPTEVLIQDLAYLKALPAPVGYRLLEANRSDAARAKVERELIARGVSPATILPLGITSNGTLQTQTVVAPGPAPVLPPGGPGTTLGDASKNPFASAPRQTVSNPNPAPLLGPQPTKQPLSNDTPPAVVDQLQAFKRANDVVKHLSSERHDP